MKDYTIKHNSTIEKMGISKIGTCFIALLFLFPFSILIYLSEFKLAFSVISFFGFILFLNIIIILPSFLKIKYKLKITNDGIAFYLFAFSQGYRFPCFRRHHIQFSSIKNYIIKKHSLTLYYQKNYGLYNAYEKREIKNLTPEECLEIKNILLKKIGDKYNTNFKQSLFAWLWQNFHLTLILSMAITICLALIYKYLK